MNLILYYGKNVVLSKNKGQPMVKRAHILKNLYFQNPEIPLQMMKLP